MSEQLEGLVWGGARFGLSIHVGCYVGDDFICEILLHPMVDDLLKVHAIDFFAAGPGDALPVLAKLAKTNGWRLVDQDAGDWIDLGDPR
jgi:hypothetical protein